ncbi:MAG: hypothetical protein WA210_13095 [Burkholderiaceae bacterium]
MNLEQLNLWGAFMMRSQKTSGRHAAKFLLSGLGLSLAAGCGGGSGQGLDEDGNLLRPASEVAAPVGAGTTTGSSGNPNATLAWVQANVFGGVCSQCHTGAGAPLGVNWSSQANTCDNVGRASAEKGTLKEIESGNAAASYVIWKVQGAGPGGEAIVPGRMPLGNPPLAEDTIRNMRDWIADGTPGC